MCHPGSSRNWPPPAYGRPAADARRWCAAAARRTLSVHHGSGRAGDGLTSRQRRRRPGWSGGDASARVAANAACRPPALTRAASGNGQRFPPGRHGSPGARADARSQTAMAPAAVLYCAPRSAVNLAGASSIANLAVSLKPPALWCRSQPRPPGTKLQCRRAPDPVDPTESVSQPFVGWRCPSCFIASRARLVARRCASTRKTT
jgi:hypothetical protein